MTWERLVRSVDSNGRPPWNLNSNPGKWLLHNGLLTSTGHKHEKFAPKSALQWALNNVLLTRTGNKYERFAPESAVKWVLNNVLLTSPGHKHEKFAPKCAVKWGRAGWQMWDHVDGFGGHLHQKVVSDTEAFSLTPLFNKHSLRPKKDGAWALLMLVFVFGSVHFNV